MKKAFLSVLAIVILGLGISIMLPTETQPQPASAQQSDKFDGECTGNERVGRCADKCPANTAEGVYFVRGFDKEHGGVVCGFSFYNGCPYVENYSATDPMCEKVRQDQVRAGVLPPDPEPMEGK